MGKIRVLDILSDLGRNVVYSKTGKNVTISMPTEYYNEIRNILNEYIKLKDNASEMHNDTQKSTNFLSKIWSKF